MNDTDVVLTCMDQTGVYVLRSVGRSALRSRAVSLTPEQRSLRARMAAHAMHAKVRDEREHTAPATKAFLSRFEREVDPEGVLPAEERKRKAEHAKKAYMTKLAMRSAAVRKKKAA